MSRGKRHSLAVALGGIVFVSAFAGIVYLGLTLTASREPTGHEGLVLHWHLKLTIEDFRLPPTADNLTIPGNIGLPGGLWVNHTLDVYGGVFAPLHTHDETGTIHVEPRLLPRARFVLEDFFNIWGVPLTSRCVWNYCADPQNGLAPPFMATKRNDFTEGCIDRGYSLSDGDEILIFIGASHIPLACA